MSDASSGRLRRLAEDLEESGLPLQGSGAYRGMVLEEIDHARDGTADVRKRKAEGSVG